MADVRKVKSGLTSLGTGIVGARRLLAALEASVRAELDRSWKHCWRRRRLAGGAADQVAAESHPQNHRAFWPQTHEKAPIGLTQAEG